jgi:hypothetical protein
VREEAVVAAYGDVPEGTVAETFLLSKEVDLSGSIGGADGPDV